MQIVEAEERVELLSIRKVIRMELEERKTLEKWRLKPREDSSGVVTGEEAFSQREVLGKMG